MSRVPIQPKQYSGNQGFFKWVGFAILLLSSQPLWSEDLSGIDPQSAVQSLSRDIQGSIRPLFYEAVALPDSASARDLPGKLNRAAEALRVVGDPPTVQALVAAEKYRLLGFLYVAEARLIGVSADSRRAQKGMLFATQRSALARQAIRDLRLARQWLVKALNKDDPDYGADVVNAVETSKIQQHIDYLEATSQAILWVLENKDEQKSAVKVLWDAIPATYLKDNYPPAPEIVRALDLAPENVQPGGMTFVSWTGVGLLLIGLIAAIAVKNASLFQQWAIRVVFAVGASMAATVIPGLLDIKISEVVAAGGTLAVIALIYLLNPPKIE